MPGPILSIHRSRQPSAVGDGRPRATRGTLAGVPGMGVFVWLSLAGLIVAGHGSALAGQGSASPDCRAQVADLKKEIEEEGSAYKLDARVKARRALAKAEVNAVRPAKCRENLREARLTLEEGRRR